MDNILIFIGARGGSKGVKGKNIRPLLGEPLINYTIKQALKWGKAKRVIISTDSEAIAEIARKAGAEVPFLRPAALADDVVAKGAAVKHAVIECEKVYQEKYDIIVDLDVTAPIRTVEDIDNCLKLFKKHKPKSLFSVVHAHKNPYFNMVEVQKDGRAQICKKPEREFTRRQDLPPVYAMNASIYFFQRDYVVKSRDAAPICDDTRVYVMGDLSGVDVDSEIDFEYIEFLVSKGHVKL